MLFQWVVRGSALVIVLLSSPRSWAADPFVRFFAHQPVGQEITVTGRFHRFHYKRQFFQRNDKTGEVRYFDYFGLTLIPTRIVGNGSFAQEANRLDTLLLLYPDEEVVKHLPEQGENVWFTGTLLGFQYGISGITNSAYSGGEPYLVLKQIATQPPPEASAPQHQNAAPAQKNKN
jgi:hypothetical protein